MNEEWEDYEEPKNDKMFWIDYDSEVVEDTTTPFDTDIKQLKKIGNYFETKEEAEKAVEKLKAWKRLKDRGFRFKTHYYHITRLEDEEKGWSPVLCIYAECINKCDKRDLDLLFGGEE